MATPITDNIVALGYDTTNNSGVASLLVYDETGGLIYQTNNQAKTAHTAVDSGLRVFVSDEKDAGTIKKFDYAGTYEAQKLFSSGVTPKSIGFKYNQSLIYVEGNSGQYDSIVFMDRNFNEISRSYQPAQYFNAIDINHKPGGDKLFTSGQSVYDAPHPFGGIRVYSTENDIATLEYAIGSYDPTRAGNEDPNGKQDFTYEVAASEDGSRYAIKEVTNWGTDITRIVVRDGITHEILQVYASTTTVPIWDSYSTASTGIALGAAPLTADFDRDNNIIIDCGANIRKYDTDGILVYSQAKTRYAANQTPTAFEVDSTGNAWVKDGNYSSGQTTDLNHVYVHQPDGTLLTTINHPTLNLSNQSISSRKAWWGAPLITGGGTQEICRTAVVLDETPVNSVVTSTAQAKYGTASLYGNNTGWLKADSLVIPQTGPFTLECFFRIPGNFGNYTTLFSNYNSAISSGSFHMSFTNSGGTYRYDSFIKDTVNGNWQYVGSYNIAQNTWCHFALERDASNNIALYHNGVKLYSVAKATTLNLNNLYIGAREFGFQAPTYNKIYMDEIRISNVARYNGNNFTPATAPYEADDDTLLLLHGEGTNGGTVFTDDNCYTVTTPGTPGNVEFVDLAATNTTTTSPLTFAKIMYRTIADTVSTTANAITRSDLVRAISASVSTAADIFLSKLYIRQISATVSAAASVAFSNAYVRVLSAVASVTPTISKIKSISLALAAAVTSSAAVQSVVFTLYKVAVAAGVTATASISKVASYFRSLSDTVIGTAAAQVNKSLIRAINAGVTATGNVAKSIGKAIQDGMGIAGSTSRGLEDIILQASAVIVASIQKSVTKAVDVGVTGTSTIQKAVEKAVDSVVNVAESVQKAGTKAINTVVSTSTSVSKGIGKVLSYTTSSAANIAKRVNAGLKVVVDVAISGSIGKSVTKALSTSVSGASSLVKYISKTFNDVVVSTEVVTRPILKIYESLMTLSAISYLKERITDVLRKTNETSTDTTHPTEATTFRKQDDV